MRTTGKLKWFDPSKGFGLVLTDEGTTVLLDARVLAAAGHATIAEDALVVVDVALEENGLAVTRLHNVVEPPQTRDWIPGAGILSGITRRRHPRSREILVNERPVSGMTGTCKWFSRAKGHGFIKSVGGDVEDAFIHMDTLRRAGIKELLQGQRVVFDAARGNKGLTVTRIVVV